MQVDLLKLGDFNTPSIPSLGGILRGGGEDGSPGRLPCPLLHDGCTCAERQTKRISKWHCIFIYSGQILTTSLYGSSCW